MSCGCDARHAGEACGDRCGSDRCGLCSGPMEDDTGRCAYCGGGQCFVCLKWSLDVERHGDDGLMCLTCEEEAEHDHGPDDMPAPVMCSGVGCDLHRAGAA